MSSPPRAALHVAAAACLALLGTACDRHVAPLEPRPVPAGPRASLLGGCTIRQPPCGGTSNLSYSIVFNASCQAIYTTFQIEDRSGGGGTVSSGSSGVVYDQGGAGGQVCAWSSIGVDPSASIRCFGTSTPLSGGLYAIPVFIYSGPVSPRKPTFRIRCGYFYGNSECPATMGVRG